MLSCDEFSENTGIQSNTEGALRIESELNLKGEIQHRFKITPSWNIPKHNTKCVQSVSSHRIESSHTHRKCAIFSPMNHHHKKMKQDYRLFLSLFATRKRVLTPEALASASYCMERC